MDQINHSLDGLRTPHPRATRVKRPRTTRRTRLTRPTFAKKGARRSPRPRQEKTNGARGGFKSAQRQHKPGDRSLSKPGQRGIPMTRPLKTFCWTSIHLSKNTSERQAAPKGAWPVWGRSCP